MVKWTLFYGANMAMVDLFLWFLEKPQLYFIGFCSPLLCSYTCRHYPQGRYPLRQGLCKLGLCCYWGLKTHSLFIVRHSKGSFLEKHWSEDNRLRGIVISTAVERSFNMDQKFIPTRRDRLSAILQSK